MCCCCQSNTLCCRLVVWGVAEQNNLCWHATCTAACVNVGCTISALWAVGLSAENVGRLSGIQVVFVLGYWCGVLLAGKATLSVVS
jgi:hypothetical protein